MGWCKMSQYIIFCQNSRKLSGHPVITLNSSFEDCLLTYLSEKNIYSNPFHIEILIWKLIFSHKNSDRLLLYFSKLLWRSNVYVCIKYRFLENYFRFLYLYLKFQSFVSLLNFISLIKSLFKKQKFSSLFVNDLNYFSIEYKMKVIHSLHYKLYE